MNSRQPFLVTVFVVALFAVCPLLFFTNLTRNPFYTQIALLNIFICACWLVWIYQGWRQKEWVWVRSPLDGALWALLGVCALSWISSYIQHPNFRQPIISEGTRNYIFLIVNTYLVYAAAVRYQDRDRLRWVLWISYVVALVASLYGIAQYYGTEWFWPHNLNPYGSRPVSTFGNPNFISSYLVLILPVVMADYVFKVSGAARVPLFVVIMAAFGALIATLTRSSWGGIVVAILFVGAGITLSKEMWPKIKTPVLILGVALVISTLAWPKSSSAAYSATVFGRITEVKQAVEGTYGAVQQRLLIWLSSWQMVEDHPVIGKGWGTFELFYPYYQSTQLTRPAFRHFRTHANNAHNEVLEYATQIGLAGLGLMFFIWILFFRTGLSITERLPGPWKGMEWGVMGGVAGMLADNLLNVSVHFAVPAFIFWWWVGSAFVLEPASLRESRFPLQPAGRRAAMAAAALLLVGLITRSAMVWAEEVSFFKGFKYSKAADLNSARLHLEKARGYFSRDVNNNYELANVYARMGEKEKALQMYQAALDANSGYDEIYFNRATMYMQAGHEAESIRNYRISLGINPTSRESYAALIGIYMKNIPQYGEDAVMLYQNALTAYPEDKDLWNNLGYLEVQRQHWEEAYQAYRKAMQIDPDFDLARRNLEIVVQKLPAHEKDPYLQLPQKFAEVEQLINAKRWMEALAKANALVDIVPRSARANFYLGSILFSMNELPQAAARFEAAIQLHPELVPAWANLGVTYDRLNRTEEAEKVWRQVIALDKNHSQAKARLRIP